MSTYMVRAVYYDWNNETVLIREQPCFEPDDKLENAIRRHANRSIKFMRCQPKNIRGFSISVVLVPGEDDES